MGAERPLSERLREQPDRSRRRRAFTALMRARLLHLAVGFAAAAHGLDTGLARWSDGAGASLIATSVLPFVLLAALAFAGFLFVVRRPRTWIAIGIAVWIWPALAVLGGAPFAWIHAVGPAGVWLAGLSFLRARRPLRTRPGLWDECLGEPATGPLLRAEFTRWQQGVALAGGLVMAVVIAHHWTSRPARPGDHENLARNLEVTVGFLEAWNSRDARRIAAWFAPDERARIRDGLPDRIAELGYADAWPVLGSAYPERREKRMRIDYPVLTGSAGRALRTQWEWNEGRWIASRIDFVAWGADGS